MNDHNKGVKEVCKHPKEEVSKGTKKIRATITQIQSYHQYKASGKCYTEKQFILGLLEFLNLPTTRRKLQELSGLGINHMTRILKTLENEGVIYVSKIDNCIYTRRRVQHYSLKLQNNE